METLKANLEKLLVLTEEDLRNINEDNLAHQVSHSTMLQLDISYSMLLDTLKETFSELTTYDNESLMAHAYHEQLLVLVGPRVVVMLQSDSILLYEKQRRKVAVTVTSSSVQEEYSTLIVISMLL